MTIKDGIYYPLGCSEGMSEGEYQAECDWEPTRDASLSEKSGHWRTRGGRVLKIAEMTVSHMENAIRYFERDGWGEHPKIYELRDELDGRTP